MPGESGRIKRLVYEANRWPTCGDCGSSFQTQEALEAHIAKEPSP